MTLFSVSDEEQTGWNEGAWLYPKAVQLLDIPEYRETLLAGFVLGASSKTDSTVRRFPVNFTCITPLPPSATPRLSESSELCKSIASIRRQYLKIFTLHSRTRPHLTCKEESWL